MENKEEIVRFFIPLLAALIVAGYWMFNGEVVRADPYMLGLFRGIMFTTILNYLIRKP